MLSRVKHPVDRVAVASRGSASFCLKSNAQYTPPTPKQLSCRVESRRRCVLNSQPASSRRIWIWSMNENWTRWEFIQSSWLHLGHDCRRVNSLHTARLNSTRQSGRVGVGYVSGLRITEVKGKVKTSIYIARFMHHAPLTRIDLRHWNWPARPLFIGHRPACKHSLGQWPNNRHRQHQPASRSPPS